jgi:hypothetical protein
VEHRLADIDEVSFFFRDDLGQARGHTRAIRACDVEHDAVRVLGSRHGRRFLAHSGLKGRGASGLDPGSPFFSAG